MLGKESMKHQSNRDLTRRLFQVPAYFTGNYEDYTNNVSETKRAFSIEMNWWF